ncbi:hypothetical protein [Kitasatospora sp. P5_F3]
MNSQDQQPTYDRPWPPVPSSPPDWPKPPPTPPKVPNAAKIALGIIGCLALVGSCSALVASGRTDRPTAAGATAGPTATVTVTAAAAPVTAQPTVTVTVTATATVTAPAEPAAAPAPAPAPAPGDTIAGNGTYLVGDDIQPGTYKTAGPGSLGLCYWERGKDSSGGFDSIIANDNLTGQGVVTIKKTDKVFKTQGCQVWTKVG